MPRSLRSCSLISCGLVQYYEFFRLFLISICLHVCVCVCMLYEKNFLCACVFCIRVRSKALISLRETKKLQFALIFLVCLVLSF